MMIRKMEDGDLDAVLQIEAGAFQAPWDRKMFLAELHENPFAHIYVLTSEQQICAYIDFWITFETAQLANIAVARPFQHQGLASQLLDEMIHLCEREMCDNITLEVHVENQRAISLYEHYGFMQAALRKGYYEDGKDAYLMIKPLGGSYV